jgi:hypothetical protein
VLELVGQVGSYPRAWACTGNEDHWYRKDVKFGDDLATYSASDMDARIIAPRNKMRELVIK